MTRSNRTKATTPGDPDIAQHCWHPRKWEGLPGGKKHGKTLITDRCCWCNYERKRIAKTIPTKGHGKYVQERDWKNLEVDDVLAICIRETCPTPKSEP